MSLVVGRNIRVFTLLGLLLLAGCATNPVTGKNEVMLIPESMEIQMGQENYQPARQMQGGDYVADPAVTAYVREVGSRLAAVSDRKLPYEFVVLNSSEVNAWAMPGGKLAINRGLLTRMDSESELAAVLGHEIIHAAAKHGAKHGAKQMQQAMLLMGAVIAANIAIQSQTDNPSVQEMGAIGTQVAATLLSSKFSRDDEREADHFGMTYMSRAGYDPHGMISTEEMLLRESQGRGNDLFSELLSTHPPSQERVDSARAFAATLPAGNAGKQVYHQRLANLFKAAPAYADYDNGMKAIKAGDYSKALTLADRAIGIEPKETQFYLLKGEALEKSHQGQQALVSYRTAANMNPGYFEPHLRIGLLLDAEGMRNQARPELERSLALLKTAPALHRLGRYALVDGNMPLAKTYLGEAAASDTDEGKVAYEELLRFDLPANPAAYVDAGMRLDANNRLQYVISNKTPFAVTGVVFEVAGPRGGGRLNANGTIAGKQQLIVPTQVQVTPEELQAMRVRIVAARLAQ